MAPTAAMLILSYRNKPTSPPSFASSPPHVVAATVAAFEVEALKWVQQGCAMFRGSYSFKNLSLVDVDPNSFALEKRFQEALELI